MNDLAGRGLAAAVRLLPPQRREWGLAMQAELAAIDAGRERRRYALGCTRAVLTQPAALRTAAAPMLLLAFGAVATGLALSYPSAGVRAETLTLVAILGLVASRARRPGRLGPVADAPFARRARATGVIVVGGSVMLMLAWGKHNDPSGWWLVALALALYFVAVLAATSRRTAARPGALQVAAAAALVGLSAWWIPMLLLAGVRSHPHTALLAVALAAAAAVLALGRRGGAAHVATAGLAAATATCLLIFLAAIGTYAAFPQLVPDIAGPGNAGGLTAAARAETNRIESTDPYVGEFLLGALFAAALISSAPAYGIERRTRR
jgi:hypothetical protein